MEVEELIGAKIIEVEKSVNFGAEIQHIIVEKDNKHIKIVGTEEYPWITYYIDKSFCPHCKIELECVANEKRYVPEYICPKCSYKE